MKIGRMKEIFYKKQKFPSGRSKYVAISEYDSNYCYSLPYGDHLISVYPGGSSRLKVIPAFAPMIAATRYSRDVIAKAIMEASDLRPKSVPISKGQRLAWEKLAKEFGDELHRLEWPAAQDAAIEAGKAMQAEAEKYLAVPAIRKAYEQFMVIYQLTKEQENALN